MLRNDEKTKNALLLHFIASKILSFYFPPDPIDATYNLYIPSVTPTNLVVPQKPVAAQPSTNHEDLYPNKL